MTNNIGKESKNQVIRAEIEVSVAQDKYDESNFLHQKTGLESGLLLIALIEKRQLLRDLKEKIREKK